MKLYFFDFDRTLCIHKYKEKRTGVSSYYDECRRCLDYGDEFMKEYGGDVPSKAMQWYVKKVLYGPNANAQGFILTNEIFNLRDNYKKAFASTYYGLANYLSVDSPAHKIEMMKAVADSMGVDWSDCQLVDDDLHTIYAANKEGMDGKHVSEVYAEYESVLSSE